MPTRRLILLVVLSAVLLQVGCDSSSPTESDEPVPFWLTNLIAQIQAQPVTNPPTEIWRYRYHGEIVYYRTARCCDIFSDLWDPDGVLLCHPDGGFGGNGDGRCPDFFDARSDGFLIFRDPRSP